MPLPRMRTVWLVVVSTNGLNEGLWPANKEGVQAYTSKKKAKEASREAKKYYKHAEVIRFVPVEG
ncbi:MAG: hypothetical protein NVS9B14_21470 [Candidatus Acidiferrum sp.]